MRRNRKTTRNEELRPENTAQGQVLASSATKRPLRLMFFLTIAALGGSAFTFAFMRSAASSTADPSLPSTPDVQKPFTLGDLLTMTSQELEKVDIAEMNLLCAQGLPGAEKLDIPKVLGVLDDWTKKVKIETERHLYRVTDPEYAEHYKHSEAVFRLEMIAQVLQEDLGVHYNKDRIRDVRFTNAKDLFIHGMIEEKNGGTCVSMPVLYTAIARRLGYPVRLVQAKSHIFCRWEGRGERRNAEAAATGFHSYDDEHYQKWPHPISKEEIQRGEFLKSLTPAEELSVFLAARGHCLEDNGRLHEAEVVYARAHQLHPISRTHYGFLMEAVSRESTPNPVYPENLPQFSRNRVDENQPHMNVNEINRANRERYEKMMRNVIPPLVPTGVNPPYGNPANSNLPGNSNQPFNPNSF